MASHILPCLLLILTFSALRTFSVGDTAPYVRPRPRETLSIPLAADADGTTPQQVHISMVGSNKMRVTWITEDDAPATVDYGSEKGKYDESSTGSTSSYTFSAMYRSGNIHETVIGPLDPDSVYYYRCNGNLAREFSFKTPPATLPVRFAVIGDLGQTGWTNSTLNHISQSNYDILLLPGDLSYADLNQPLWDSYARLVEPLASNRPWMVTQGNHEIESIPLVESTPFKPYNARYHMPYEQSSSPSNLFYSFDVSGGAIHVLMLASYANFSLGSDQFNWLQEDLAKVNRSNTVWLFAVIHAPWYSSNKAHRGEGDDMKRAMEGILYENGVDVVFAGHVHAYERFTSVYDDKEDECAPVHITIGDGGNREGLASKYIDPQPSISLFREASFGHGQLYVANNTHALWSWHRNDDDYAVIVDSVWITSLLSKPSCKKNN